LLPRAEFSPQSVPPCYNSGVSWVKIELLLLCS
jgi:hypothetical protein